MALFVASFVFVGIVDLLGIPYNIFVRFIFQTTSFSGLFIMAMETIGEMFVEFAGRGFRLPSFFSRANEGAARANEIRERAHAWMDTWRGLAILWIVFALIGRDDNVPLFTVLHATCGSAIVWLVAYRWTGRESSF